ncbi:MAG TPA: hypothetical protein VLH77_04425 [Gammaproteobacteria bacterium]|nr:hypothetical protein [Gammaproteobacteria bacterium]
MARLPCVLILFCLLFAHKALASMRDPTQPAISEEQATRVQVPVWELQAIIISKGRKMAIFNGNTLYLGSEVSGFKVVKITPNTVHLEGPDGKMILFLNQRIKKPVAGLT